MELIELMERIGLKEWKWSKDWRMEGLLGKNGKGMAHYMTLNGRTSGIGLMGGKVSVVLGACGKVERTG
jgi:hypothetical protein